MMTKKLPKTSFFEIKRPDNLYSTMHKDVKLLYDNGSYVTCTMVVLCCIDALAAGRGGATSGKFFAFVKKHFQELCADLDGTVPRKTGEMVLWDFFRNGFAHLFTPKPGYAIAEDHELDGRYAGIVELNGGGKFIAINADRLTEDFLKLIDSLKKKIK